MYNSVHRVTHCSILKCARHFIDIVEKWGKTGITSTQWLDIPNGVAEFLQSTCKSLLRVEKEKWPFF